MSKTETKTTVEGWALALDVEVTARKRWHYAIDPTGETVYASHRSSDVIEWLYLQDVLEFTVISKKITAKIRLVDVAPF